jgi:cyclase
MVVIDVKRSGQSFQALTHNGTRPIKSSLEELLQSFQDLGAGEIVVNSIDRDGTGQGFDLELVSTIIQHATLPLTIIGGAANLEDCAQLNNEFGPIGIGAGSMFVFKGKYRAVLITYPSRSERDQIFA